MGLVASALGAWVDAAATAMAVVVPGGSLLTGVVMVRRPDQPLHAGPGDNPAGGLVLLTSRRHSRVGQVRQAGTPGQR
jgi:hypothetical protein